MPRYYMNLRYRDRLFRDAEGDELPGEGAVLAHARAIARDLMARGRLDSIRDWTDCSFEVTDEAGGTVLVVPFAESFEAD